MRKVAVLIMIVCFLAVGCSGMSYTAQRTLTGGAGRRRRRRHRRHCR